VSSQTIGEVSPATKVTGVTLWVKATEPDFVKSSGTLIVMEANDVLALYWATSCSVSKVTGPESPVVVGKE
jgi:hypothetical protein